jgi:hypothetical protein
MGGLETSCSVLARNLALSIKQLMAEEPVNTGFSKSRRVNCFNHWLLASPFAACFCSAVNLSAVPVRAFCNYLSH